MHEKPHPKIDTLDPMQLAVSCGCDEAVTALGSRSCWDGRAVASFPQTIVRWQDSNAACRIDGINNENITWADFGAPSGAYAVRVNLWSACDVPGPFSYVVTIKRCGQITDTIAGILELSDEFPGGAGDGRIVSEFNNEVPIRSVKVWVKAFIPRDIPGYTQELTSGPYRGQSVIPHPVLSYCYLTDQRDFGSSENASARMTSSLTVTGLPDNMAVQQRHYIGDTVEVQCGSGNRTCMDNADSGRMHFTVKGAQDHQVSVRLEAAARNPCSLGTAIAGDIDYTGTILIDLHRSTVSFDGLVDDFPWFEAYVSINDGDAEKLFQHRSANDATVISLVGNAENPVVGRVAARCTGTP
jgi:hypothetical protein